MNEDDSEFISVEYTSLEDVVLKWKMKYGVLARGKKWDNEYYQIPIRDRLELLTILVRTFQSMGRPREWFTSSKKDDIVKLSIPFKGSVSSESYKGFLGGTQRHLNEAICGVYDAEELANKEELHPEGKKESEMEDFVPSTEKKESDYELDPEMAELLGLSKK